MGDMIKDSHRMELDPRSLKLDPAMQARDTALIKDKRVRAAQEIKQASQDKEILEDLNNGLPIRQPISVYVVDGVRYVVDGFHRTGACLKFLEANPDAELKVPALVINNRSYIEAFKAAQEANQSHGVGVTHDELIQSKFRSLVVAREGDLSVSDIQSVVGCSRGQAAHIRHALRACVVALQQHEDIEVHDLAGTTQALQEAFTDQYQLTASAWDSKGFPRIRKLSDAVTGKGWQGKEQTEAEWEQAQIQRVSDEIGRLLGDVDPDYFREGLRKATRGLGLDISITQRKKWLEKAGNVEGDEAPEQWDGTLQDPDF